MAVTSNTVLQDALAEMTKIEQIYAPGGTFMKGGEATYEKGKRTSLASTMQRMVSSGLAGTSTGANIEKAYEEDVGGPFRLQLEDLRMQRLSEALQGKASVLGQIAQIEQQYLESERNRDLQVAEFNTTQDRLNAASTYGTAEYKAAESARNIAESNQRMKEREFNLMEEQTNRTTQRVSAAQNEPKRSYDSSYNYGETEVKFAPSVNSIFYGAAYKPTTTKPKTTLADYGKLATSFMSKLW